jgi:large subunit ribosomal protein L21
MDYAVIRAGGRQIKVSAGDVVAVERVDGNPGDRIAFDQVLAAKIGEGDARLGSPLVNGAKVEAVIQEQARGRKVFIRKFRRRKGYMRVRGHRQYETRVRIEAISA